MLRRIIVTFSWVLCFTLPTAQAEVPAALRNQSPQHAEAAPQRGALFKVTKADNTLFLFGTIHVGMADFYPLEATVMTALAQSSKVALEVNPLDDQKVQAALRRYGFYPPGKSLNLKPAQKLRLAAALNHRGMPYNAIAPFQPWMVATILTLNEFAAQGFQSTLGVDTFIAGFARSRNKPIVELETVEGQLATFGTLSHTAQLQYLDDTLNEIEDKTGIEKVTRLTRLWRTADRTGLDAMAEELAADPTYSGRFFQEVLLEQRNPGLASGIEKLLKTETQSFAGIGLFHLVGKQSVPEILTQRGYRVERIY